MGTVTIALADTERRLRDEQDKRERWREENCRRKHSYTPFIVNMLRLLAKKNMLGPLLDKCQK